MSTSPLLQLTAAALTGLASRPAGGHGVRAPTTEEIGAMAVALAKGAMKALEAAEPDQHNDHTPTVKPRR